MKLRIVFFIFLLCCLVGCVGNPKIVTKEKTVPVYPPDALMIDCVLVAPPNSSVYLSANAEEKEKLLSDTLGDFYYSVGGCNERLLKLREWSKKQHELYENKTDR